jgi:hypothetical protein
MPGLDAVARRRLARALVSLEGVIAQCEAHVTEDDEPKLELLKHLRDDIRIVLDQDAARRLPGG